MPRLEFAIPEGYEPPADAKEGQPFEDMGKFIMKPNGTMCLVMVNGAPVGGYKGDDEKGEMMPDDEAAEGESDVDTMTRMINAKRPWMNK